MRSPTHVAGPPPRRCAIPTREQLVDAARQVITEHGVGGATTRLIARTAGCSEGTLYNHFADKRELLVVAMSEELPAFVQFIDGFPDRAGTGTVRGNLEELVRRARAFYVEILPFLAPTFTNPELRERHRAKAIEYGRGPHTTVRAVAEYVRGERKAGRVSRKADPDAVAMLLIGACFHHAALDVGIGIDLLDQDPDDFVSVTVKSLLAGLAPTPKGR